VKISSFFPRKGKTSPYLPRNELYSAFKGKIYAYFTILGYRSPLRSAGTILNSNVVDETRVVTEENDTVDIIRGDGGVEYV
jgi:hypothetical protein